MSFVRERLKDFDTEGCKNVAKVGGKGCGCAVLIVGGASVVVGLLGGVLGASCSLRLSPTESNVSAFIASGDKKEVETIEPDFIKKRDRDIAIFDEQLEISLFGWLRVKQIFTIGIQPNSPRIWSHLEIPEYKNNESWGVSHIGITITDNNQQGGPE